MRKIKHLNTVKESTNHMQKVTLCPATAPDRDGHFSSYEENVYYAGLEALKKGGMFYNMFAAGDGHELEDYTDKKGRVHLAHAKSIFSSSMLAYNFFHWISPEHPLKYFGTTFDKVYFEVKFPVIAKTTKGRPVNRPSNMDVVLISDDCMTMVCFECKYTEHKHNQAAKFSDAYFKHSCYYQGNPYIASFIQLALRYNEQKKGYYAGIKQNVSHLIGLSNVKHDTDALAWFKTHNPFIEPEVMEQIGAHMDIYFTNLLYFRPEEETDLFGDIHAERKAYTYLLEEFTFEHLRGEIELEFIPCAIFNTYADFFAQIRPQMSEELAAYLEKKYQLNHHE